jgi:hypothetical protein
MTTRQHPPNDIRSLWQSMPTTPVIISPEEMRAKARTFERRIRRRNATEYIASACVVAIFGWYATFPEPATPLWPIANLMIIAGTLVVVWNLHRLARARNAQNATSFGALIDFHRAELVRQRDALKTVWLWYIMPVAPGVIAWFIAMSVGMPHRDPARIAIGVGGTALVVVLVFGGIILLNLLGAAHLQRQIDDLDRYKETN